MRNWRLFLFGPRVAIQTNIHIEICRVRQYGMFKFVKIWGDLYKLLSDGKVQAKPYWTWEQL